MHQNSFVHPYHFQTSQLFQKVTLLSQDASTIQFHQVSDCFSAGPFSVKQWFVEVPVFHLWKRASQ